MFADLGLADAEKLQIESGLVVEPTRAMFAVLVCHREAGWRIGVPQPKASVSMCGDFVNLSERKLMRCLNRLAGDIEIKVPIIQLSRLSEARYRVCVY